MIWRQSPRHGAGDTSDPCRRGVRQSNMFFQDYVNCVGERRRRRVWKDMWFTRDGADRFLVSLRDTVLYTISRDEVMTLPKVEVFSMRIARLRFECLLGHCVSHVPDMRRKKLRWRAIGSIADVPMVDGDSFVSIGRNRWKLRPVWVEPPPPIKSPKIKRLLVRMSKLQADLAAAIQEQHEKTVTDVVLPSVELPGATDVGETAMTAGATITEFYHDVEDIDDEE
jgi:hypothetical protein